MANLILYYSRRGENYVNGSIQSISKGNTERVAEFVQKSVGGDLFEIEPVREYSASYMTCIKEAQAEQRAGERPAVKHLPESLDGYDTVFIGYPNWWGTLPMFMFTVLDTFDWTGKKIVPFCTNEGSGLAAANGISRHPAPARRFCRDCLFTAAARPPLRNRWLRGRRRACEENRHGYL